MLTNTLQPTSFSPFYYNRTSGSGWWNGMDFLSIHDLGAIIRIRTYEMDSKIIPQSKGSDGETSEDGLGRFGRLKFT